VLPHRGERGRSGPGDRFVAARLAEVANSRRVAVNKTDVASRDDVIDHLAQASVSSATSPRSCRSPPRR